MANIQSPGLAMLQPRSAIFQAVQIIFAATNVPQRLPNIKVPSGLSVGLTGTTGSAANTELAYAASDPANLLSQPRVVIPPSTSPESEVQYPADSMNQIWVMGTAGDGLLAIIRGSAIG